MFEVKALSSIVKTKQSVFSPGRYLIGRSESCDMIISHDSISAIHAVIEIFEGKAIIYDMNSTNGTYVNGEKVVVKEFSHQTIFSLSGIDFKIESYREEVALPPVLDILEPMKGEASVKTQLPQLPVEALSKAVEPKKTNKVVYPLTLDPKAEMSEYIFEDKDELYPIFNYHPSKQAVEVIILFKDQIFSIDYLPEGKETYFIAGSLIDSDNLVFPYLGKAEKVPFVEVSGSKVAVHTLPGFETLLLSDRPQSQVKASATTTLSSKDILRMHKGDLQIFVREVAAPPEVAPAPILKRDPEFRKYLAILVVLLLMTTIGFNVVEVPEPEKIDELAPERLATILYKQPLTVSKNKAVEKTENAPKIAQKSPTKVATKKTETLEKQPDIKNPDVITTKDQTSKPDPGKKTAQEKKVVKQGTTPVTKPTDQIMASAQGSASPSAKSVTTKSPTAYSQYQAKTQGHVEVYKSVDFKSSVSSLVAKGGSLSGVQTKTVSGSSSGDFAGVSASVGSGTGSIKTVGITTSQGSLVGAASGALGESKGAEGLSAKTSVYTAGIPSETVVLGSMDPDVIRRILLEHLPQFRYCYQKELERSGAEMAGAIKLNFTIGASGHVSQAGVDGSSNLPTDVKKCVVGVLRGIQFPEPMGGGTVEVKQPMNFYPKKI